MFSAVTMISRELVKKLRNGTENSGYARLAEKDLSSMSETLIFASKHKLNYKVEPVKDLICNNFGADGSCK